MALHQSRVSETTSIYESKTKLTNGTTKINGTKAMNGKTEMNGKTDMNGKTNMNGITDTNGKTHMNGKTAKQNYKYDFVWRNIIVLFYFHLAAVVGAYITFSGRCSGFSIVFQIVYGYFSGVAVTAGTHRLWTHRSYKARWPLKVFLAFFQAAAFQNNIYEWVRDHRVHHKFCDTDADPHNSRRGFFFSHMGWLFIRKHQEVTEKGKSVDMTDVENDPIVMFQKKYYLPIMSVACFGVPMFIPWFFWGEHPITSYFLIVFRYIFILNGTWCVNSVAHLWGDKPYDRNLSSTNTNFVGIWALGEGWHNYHHAFPWDYKASELWNINVTTRFIDYFARIGWAYDLKEASDELIRRRALRTGDGTPTQVLNTGEKFDPDDYIHDENHHIGEVWGYGDRDLPQEEKDLIIIKNRLNKHTKLVNQ